LYVVCDFDETIISLFAEFGGIRRTEKAFPLERKVSFAKQNSDEV